MTIEITTATSCQNDNDLSVVSFCGPESILEKSKTRKMIEIAIGKRGGYHIHSVQLTKEQAQAVAWDILRSCGYNSYALE